MSPEAGCQPPPHPAHCSAGGPHSEGGWCPLGVREAAGRRWLTLERRQPRAWARWHEGCGGADGEDSAPWGPGRQALPRGAGGRGVGGRLPAAAPGGPSCRYGPRRHLQKPHLRAYGTVPLHAWRGDLRPWGGHGRHLPHLVSEGTRIGWGCGGQRLRGQLQSWGQPALPVQSTLGCRLGPPPHPQPVHHGTLGL